MGGVPVVAVGRWWPLNQIVDSPIDDVMLEDVR